VITALWSGEGDADESTVGELIIEGGEIKTFGGTDSAGISTGPGVANENRSHVESIEIRNVNINFFGFVGSEAVREAQSIGFGGHRTQAHSSISSAR
jgi:hypothetical protein